MATPRKPRGSREKQRVLKPPPADAPARDAPARDAPARDAPARDAAHVPTHQEIEVRAYYIWNAHAFHDSDPVSDWLRAEQQLSDEYARITDEATRRPPAQQAVQEVRPPSSPA